MEDLRRVWRQVFGQYQRVSQLRPGLIGDGIGNVPVSGKPGWSWIRYYDDLNRLSQVRNIIGQLTDGTPVMVGKRHPTDDYDQVLWVYWGPYSWDPSQGTMDQYATPPHGDTHAGKSVDPVPVDYNNLSPGKVVPTSPASLEVTVQDFIFADGLDVWEWMSDEIDLSSSVPVSLYTDVHRYTIVHMEVATHTLGVVDGTVVPIATTPTIPVPQEGTIPLAVVELTNGQTTITRDDIYQYKLLYGELGGFVPTHTHEDDTEGGSSLLSIEELMLTCWEDLLVDAGQIYPIQVYHRLVVPPGLYISEGVVSVDLITIHADPVYGCGQLLVLRAPESALYADFQVRLRHATGNIWLNAHRDLTLHEGGHIILVYDGVYWHDLGMCCSDTTTHKSGQVTVAGDGTATITFNTAFPDTNYAVTCTAWNTQGDQCFVVVTAKSAQGFSVIVYDNDGAAEASEVVEWIALTHNDP